MKTPRFIHLTILILLSLVISKIINSNINFPLKSITIIGEYSEKNYHPINDYLKYLIYIFLPLLIFLLSRVIYDANILNNFKLNINYKPKYFTSGKFSYTFLFFILIILSLEFLAVDFPKHKIDLFHEGQKLSATFKNINNNSLWSGSYVIVGVFFEIISSKFAWFLTKNESIGSVRLFDLVYIYITKILLVILAFQLTKFVKIENKLKNIFFILLSVFFISQLNYNTFSIDTISIREIPIILVLIFFLEFLNRNHKIFIIAIGLITILTFFWSIDRAVVLFIFTLWIYFFLIMNKKYYDVCILISTKILFIIIFYILLNDEFVFFIDNTLNVFKEHSYVNGIIHPEFFSNDKNSFRASKTLIGILLSLIISIDLFISKHKKFNFDLRMILISISFLSFLSYIYALGRSDGPHIKQSFSFLSLFFSFYILSLIFLNFENYFKKFLNLKYFFLLTITIIFLFSYAKNINFINIKNFNERLNQFIFLNDSEFLRDEEKIFVNEVIELFKGERCIQILSNDAALYYLLKKEHCSKFYFFYSLGSNYNQKRFISDLEIKEVKYIILGGKTDSWGISIDKKYPIVLNYVLSNYSLYKKLNSRMILVRN